ncbi:MAG TPA: serine hydrolase domain-containing protein [Sandaracinaceae bacterium LLY-WYZ-13_1]|nr:serine hydrolase domain-containing protein [Sandaracinaceae bacterium LLY-WYZ-13_1]
MTRRLSWIALAGLLVLPACDGVELASDAAVDASPRVDAPPTPDAGPPEDLDGFVEHHMVAGGLPGVAAAIVRPDGVAWTGTYGYADLESERPVDEHTLFIMASVSKTIAAVRAMQLVEAGQLDLDAPVETYLDFTPRHPEHPDAPITTRMLLNHVSGLTDSFGTLAEVTTVGDPTETLGGFAEGYCVEGGAYYDAEDNWGAAPGTERAYCNAGYGVVGHVLERAGGGSLRAQSEAAIFAPLAMDGAGWFLADVDEDRVATPYAWNGRRYNPLPHNGFAFYPASSLRVSVAGLSRFARMLLNGGALDGTRVLDEASVEELLRPQIPAIDGRQALTFRERRVAGHLYVGHSGSTFGGSTQLLLGREGTHAILLFTNSDAYVRSRLGIEEGARAMEAILERLAAEARVE